MNIIKVDGDLVCTIEPTLTSVGLIQKFKPKGVKASLGEDVDEESFLDDRGTGEKYGWIKKGSKEYENYLYFMDKFFGKLNTNAVEEARTPLAAGKAFNIPNNTIHSLLKGSRVFEEQDNLIFDSAETIMTKVEVDEESHIKIYITLSVHPDAVIKDLIFQIIQQVL